MTFERNMTFEEKLVWATAFSHAIAKRPLNNALKESADAVRQFRQACKESVAEDAGPELTFLYGMLKTKNKVVTKVPAASERYKQRERLCKILGSGVTADWNWIEEEVQRLVRLEQGLKEMCSRKPE